ncbi:MAG: CopG family transcriptional regulator [bacterium]|nr:CopG family transcriptional regulator [bacterium]
MTKLTLSVDEATIESAKKLARDNGTSVSDMFRRFVQSMARGPKDFKIGPLTRKLTGIAKLPPGKDYKEALTDALFEKYGIDE